MAKKYTVQPWNAQNKDDWNNFVNNANGGTLFHRLDFLGYHGDKFFQNEHHLTIEKGRSLFGVFPAAVFSDDKTITLRSPYGGSYGGPVFASPLTYSESCGVVEAILSYLDAQSISRTVLTLPIPCCYREYSCTFRLVLQQYGFSLSNRDVSSVVRTDRDVTMTSRARNMCRKAESLNVQVVRNASFEDFWHLLMETYDRHGSLPTHSRAELQRLRRLFPERVYFNVAYLEREPVAGVACFVTNSRVNCSFYLCHNDDGRRSQASSLLVRETLQDTRNGRFTWHDFGTSSANMEPRPNIFRFKESFGAVGVFRESFTYESIR